MEVDGRSELRVADIAATLSCLFLSLTVLALFLPFIVTLTIACMLSALIIFVSIHIQIFIRYEKSSNYKMFTRYVSVCDSAGSSDSDSDKRINWREYEEIDWEAVQVCSRLCFEVLSVLLLLLCCNVKLMVLIPLVIAFASWADDSSAALLDHLAGISIGRADDMVVSAESSVVSASDCSRTSDESAEGDESNSSASEESANYGESSTERDEVKEDWIVVEVEEKQ